MGKVAIVGVEGSGKTVLMAGLCECFKQVPGSDDPYLMPENQAAFKFMETVPYALRVKREWPSATGIDNLRAMRWTYRYEDEIIETIELLDYPGELYRLAFGDSEEIRKDDLDAKQNEIRKFLDHLIDADTLLVLLNLSDIVNLGENPKNLETVWITRGIFDYAKKLPNIKRTLLVFTQADRHAAALEAVGSEQALYEAKLPMLKCVHPDLKVIAMSAMSEMDADGRPQSDYSAAGCLEVMRYVLAEKDCVAQRYLALCETNLERINQFNAGNTKNFSNIVTDYSNSIAELINASKPLKQLYAERVEQHERRIAQLSDLVCDALYTVKGASLDALATSEAWASIREKHKDYEHVFAAFLQHYKRQQELAVAEVERLKELAVVEAERQKKLALEEMQKSRNAAIQAKKRKKQSLIAACVIGGVIVVLLVLVLHYRSEQARLEKIKQRAAIEERRVEAAQVEAEMQQRITAAKKIIGKAEVAKEGADWERVKELLEPLKNKTDYADAGEKLPELSAAVKTLLDEAEANRESKLKIVTLIEGREVTGAVVKFDGKEYESPLTCSVKKKRRYEIEAFVAEHYCRRYCGSKIINTVDWLEEKTLKLELKFDSLVKDLKQVSNASYPSDFFYSYSAQDHQQSLVKKAKLPLEVESVKSGMRFRLVPAGDFTMGSPNHEQDMVVASGVERKYVEAEKQHKVEITRPFYCAKFEVTQGQWKKVMGRTLEDQVRLMLQDDTIVDIEKNQTSRDFYKKEKDSDPAGLVITEGDDYPVYFVSWDDCDEFVKRLCKLEGVPDGTYRLLTEAQWEYACRAETDSAFYNGGLTIRGSYKSQTLDVIAWYNGTGPRQVGGKEPNSWGMYDMTGNMIEWCSDLYGEYPSVRVKDPQGCASGSSRVARGGSWCSSAMNCRSAYRNWYSPSYRCNELGLRIQRIILSSE